MKTVAFVPIRLNSSRVAGKNLRPLGGRPLMTYILQTLLQVRNIDVTYVYCSDTSIAPLLPAGVTLLQRDTSLDSDTTLGEQIYDAFTREVQADIYVLAHATSPFIRPATIEEAVARVQSGECDSAFSAERIQTFAWYGGQPLNYSLTRAPHAGARTGLCRDVGLLCLRARRMVQTSPPYRRASLRCRHRPYREHRHRQPRRLHSGRSHRRGRT